MQKNGLLVLANSVSNAKHNPRQKSAHKRSQKIQLSWDDLHALFLKADLKTFQRRTFLSKKQVQQLFDGIADYAIKATRANQLRSAIKLLEEVESCTERKEPKEKIGMLLQTLVKLLEQRRAYIPNTGALDLLMHELANKYLYRKEQIKKVIELSKASRKWKETLAQMPTGFGKTKTVNPTLGREQRGKLVFNIHPSFIGQINTQDSREQYEKSYRVRSDALWFDRSVDLTSEVLEKRYQELLKDIQEGRPVNTTPESMRALQLHFLLALEQFSLVQASNLGLEQESQKMIEFFIRIQRLIKIHGFAIIDESHQTLNPKDKLIYTLGGLLPLPEEEVKLTETLFTLISDLFEKDLDIANNNHALNIKGNYQEKIVPDLIKRFAVELEIGEKERELFEKFVTGVSDPHLSSWIENHPMRREISFVKGQLLFVLESCLKGYVDENYGLSKKHISRKEFAIPYVNSNSPKETDLAPSQFQNPHETLNKTYITYLHKGLDVERNESSIFNKNRCEFIPVNS
jgi:hypothetical protein